MTPELTTFFERAAAAERVGDVDEALMYHGSIPMFRRSRHRAMLEQLAGARAELTPWVYARWIVYQAIRCKDRGSCAGRRLRGASRDAVESFHGDLLDTAYVEGGDAQQRILAPGQQGHWQRWAELVPPPARTRLMSFAEATADAA